MKYQIEETVKYEIEASSFEEAEEKFLQCEDKSALMTGITDREIYQTEGEATPRNITFN